MSKLEPVRKIKATDAVEPFDCGQFALNQFLQRHALNNQGANSAQTYVCCEGCAVVGFYSLTVGSVDRSSVGAKASIRLKAIHPGRSLFRRVSQWGSE